MHVLISIEDQKTGGVHVKTIVHPIVVGEASKATEATQLADFLLKAVETWQGIEGMNMRDAHRFIDTLVNQPAVKH